MAGESQFSIRLEDIADGYHLKDDTLTIYKIYEMVIKSRYVHPYNTRYKKEKKYRESVIFFVKDDIIYSMNGIKSAMVNESSWAIIDLPNWKKPIKKWRELLCGVRMTKENLEKMSESLQMHFVLSSNKSH
jgi:hypothetical protein